NPRRQQRFRPRTGCFRRMTGSAVATTRGRGAGTPGAVTRDVVTAFVASRAIADSFIAIAALASGGDVLRHGFGAWDGRWYAGIARLGYGVHFHNPHQAAWPFFPLLPALLRVAARMNISLPAAGLTISHLAFLVALFGVQRLLGNHCSPRATRVA